VRVKVNRARTNQPRTGTRKARFQVVLDETLLARLRVAAVTRKTSVCAILAKGARAELAQSAKAEK
jgi:hypothetical protein